MSVDGAELLPGEEPPVDNHGVGTPASSWGLLRREELVELTHLSVRQYQRPNGEGVALLVVSCPRATANGVVLQECGRVDVHLGFGGVQRGHQGGSAGRARSGAPRNRDRHWSGPIGDEGGHYFAADDACGRARRAGNSTACRDHR